MAENDQPRRVHAIVTGDVQGVGFRDFVQRFARSRRLAGWVRNLSSGQVECLAEGPEPALAALLERLREGPRGAEVDDVRVDWQDPGRDLTDFRVEF